MPDSISYSRPIDLGWKRMQHLLLKPFNLGRWMVLGFTAWLATLTDSSGGGWDGLQFVIDLDPDDYDRRWSGVWESLTDVLGRGFETGLILFVVFVGLVAGVVILWLSSRGHFMFLDNLVHRRTEVAAPWSEYRREADSLFVWRLVFALVAMVVVGFLVGGFVVVLVPMSFFDVPTGLGLPVAVGLGTLLFVAVVALAYVEYFLNRFVVPIMYRHRLQATAAWSLFLDLFRRHPGSFAVMGLLSFALTLAMTMALALAGVLTCCLGLIILALPYLGSVAALPMTVAISYINLEFLGQFSDDFRLLSPLDPAPAGAPGGGSVQFEADGTVVRTEDVGEDPGRDEPGPQAP